MYSEICSGSFRSTIYTACFSRSVYLSRNAIRGLDFVGVDGQAPFVRSDKLARDFREFVDDRGGHVSDPSGALCPRSPRVRPSDRPRGAAAGVEAHADEGHRQRPRLGVHVLQQRHEGLDAPLDSRPRLPCSSLIEKSPRCSAFLVIRSCMLP